jgi:NAD(P)-dependent dehydrogenase (short-subunit alcohol dehydrogenase family)
MSNNTFRGHTRDSADHEVILITHAGTDSGFTAARALLAAGKRVVVTARSPSSLSRILLGRRADHVLAIAADCDDAAQLDSVLRRAEARLGVVTQVIDGCRNQLTKSVRPVPLSIAS